MRLRKLGTVFYEFVQSILLDTANSATSHLLPKIIEPQYINRLTRTPNFFCQMVISFVENILGTGGKPREKIIG